MSLGKREIDSFIIIKLLRSKGLTLAWGIAHATGPEHTYPANLSAYLRRLRRKIFFSHDKHSLRIDCRTVCLCLSVLGQKASNCHHPSNSNFAGFFILIKIPGPNDSTAQTQWHRSPQGRTCRFWSFVYKFDIFITCHGPNHMCLLQIPLKLSFHVLNSTWLPVPSAEFISVEQVQSTSILLHSRPRMRFRSKNHLRARVYDRGKHVLPTLESNITCLFLQHKWHVLTYYWVYVVNIAAAMLIPPRCF